MRARRMRAQAVVSRCSNVRARKAESFYPLVGAGEQRRRNVDAERFGSLSNERAGRTAARKPRVAGSGRLKCSMRAVQSYPFRQPALRMLPDRSPANAAFVAWRASLFRIM